MPIEPFVDYEGKYVMVTGASSGIGRSIAIELSKRNARLILASRNTQELEKTATMLLHNDYEIFPIDLSVLEEIFMRTRELAKNIGEPIYGLCHSAGVVETRPLRSIKIESFRSMMDINLMAGIELARAICRRDVITQSGGAILFISSIYSLIGMPGQITYSASKGAVKAAARTMAIELARRSIRVNTISPGFVHTKMTEVSLKKLSPDQVKKIEDLHPLRTGTPEDVARAAVFMLAPQNSWITGADFVMDGGYTAW